MNSTVATLFEVFLYLLMAAIIARSLMSWFPIPRDNPLVRFLYQVTEPLLEPVRKIMPRTGMIDLSPMVVIILLYVMVFVVNRAATS